MNIAHQLQIHGTLSKADIRAKHLTSSSKVSPVMATPAALAAGVAASAALVGAFAGGFGIGQAIG